MRKLLLASASIVAFAGAAAAQDPLAITFGGEAELGFNDVEEDGYFYSADLIVSFTTELAGGVVTTVDFVIPVVDGTLDGENTNRTEDFVIGVVAEGFGSFLFGDTPFAAESRWDPGFAMASDDFSEQDNETAIFGSSTIAGFDVALSAVVADPGGDDPGAITDVAVDDPTTPEDESDNDLDIYVDQISFGASGSVGLFAVDLAYQEDSRMIVNADGDTFEGQFDTDNGDFTTDELFAVAAGLTFRGADIKFAYSTNLTGVDTDGDGEDDTDTESYGVLVRFPVGPLALAASYTIEPDAEEIAADGDPSFDTSDVNDFSYRIEAEYDAGRFYALVYYEEEIGSYESGADFGFEYSEVTQFAFGYVDSEGDEDEGGYAAARVGLGENAYFEASYSEFTDAGIEEYREGSTVLVGLTF